MAKKRRRVLKWFGIVVAVIVLAAGVAFAVAYARSDNVCPARAAVAPKHPIRAVVYCDYGSSKVLEVVQIEKPVPAADQVLVRVRAASVNPLDWHYMRGEPYVMRFDSGLRKPSVTRIGVDFAGTVEAVGNRVTQFKPGDEVFGARTGAFSEYVAAREATTALKPSNLTFEEAAAVPVAAITALQAVRDKGKVSAGKTVLINGASGGVGTFAVQIAKLYGGEVTGVCSTRNVKLVQSLGADHVIDYTRADFTQGGQKYDVIIDMVGNHPVSVHKRVLTPNGIYVIVGGPKGRWLAPLDRIGAAAIASIGTKQKLGMLLANMNQGDLTVLRNLLQERKIKSVIDRTYRLDEVSKAIDYLEAGHAKGKIVITVN